MSEISNELIINKESLTLLDLTNNNILNFRNEASLCTALMEDEEGNFYVSVYIDNPNNDKYIEEELGDVSCEEFIINLNNSKEAEYIDELYDDLEKRCINANDRICNAINKAYYNMVKTLFYNKYLLISPNAIRTPGVIFDNDYTYSSFSRIVINKRTISIKEYNNKILLNNADSSYIFIIFKLCDKYIRVSINKNNVIENTVIEENCEGLVNINYVIKDLDKVNIQIIDKNRIKPEHLEMLDNEDILEGIVFPNRGMKTIKTLIEANSPERISRLERELKFNNALDINRVFLNRFRRI